MSEASNCQGNHRLPEISFAPLAMTLRVVLLLSTDSDNNIAQFGAGFDIPMRFDDLLQGIGPINERFYFPLFNKPPEENQSLDVSTRGLHNDFVAAPQFCP